MQPSRFAQSAGSVAMQQSSSDLLRSSSGSESKLVLQGQLEAKYYDDLVAWFAEGGWGDLDPRKCPKDVYVGRRAEILAHVWNQHEQAQKKISKLRKSDR